jgi:hypothetical protein
MSNLYRGPFNKHSRHMPFFFLIGWFLKKSSLKPLSQMNWNLVEGMYGKSSIKMLISSRFVNKRFLLSFGSTGKAVLGKIFRNRPIWNKNCLWQQCLLTNCDEMSNLYRGSCFWLVYFLQISRLTPPGQMNRNLVGNILGRSFTKTAHLHTIR